MKKVTLTQIDISGIQDYIFGSNNLRQNIGASELVTRATTEWVVETLNQEGHNHNAEWLDDQGNIKLHNKSIAMPGVTAEVVYAGGGNALILFDGLSEKYAIPFTKALTRKTLKEARGLFIVVDHAEFDWDTETLSDQHRQLREKVGQRKLTRQPDIPALGLSVTAACAFTAQPVVGTDPVEINTFISSIVQHKVDRAKTVFEKGQVKAKETANYRLHHILPQVSQNNYEFVRDFELFGEKGESSYIAVVHIDGNGMGKRFLQIAQEHPRPSDNPAYVKQLRALSKAVNDKALTALRATVDLLIHSVEESPDGKKAFGGVVEIRVKDGRNHIPFRPIIFGGDDATFVCEGRLGLALAVKYLHTLAQGDLPGAEKGQQSDPLFARAGVAVVKSHYPFSRAYELAEALAKSAKRKIKDLTPAGKGIVLDWHFSTTGEVLSLDELRAREYTADNDHSLLMRPVRIDITAAPPESKYWHSWSNFERVVDEFQTDKAWAGKRNKIKALRDTLRQGASAVVQFRTNYEQGLLPDIPGQRQMPETGWQAEDCGYFDAIEALDFYVGLEKKAKTL